MNSTNEMISAVCHGKSFADIGPLWGLQNEKLSVAHDAGATRITAFDGFPSEDPIWSQFRERMANKKIEAFDCISGDATGPNFISECGHHDVVHCAGIIYHCPSPMLLIENLYKITDEYLILASMTVPETIKTDAGVLELGDAQALFVPALGDAQRTVLTRHFDSLGLVIDYINKELKEPWYWPGPFPNFGPWWWLLTPPVIKSMLITSGFEVIEVAEVWTGRAHAFLCKKHG